MGYISKVRKLIDFLGGWRINGTAVTTTAAELNKLAGNAVTAADLTKLNGITATAAEVIAAADLSEMATSGHHPLQVAVAVFDASIAGNQSINAHGLGVTIPANGFVVGGWIETNTVFHSAGADAGTIAIHVEGAGDIQVAAACNAEPWATIGRKAIVPKINTPQTTTIKATVAREITATVVGQILSAGKATVYLIWFPGTASA